jgi:hypothetical protein
VPVFDAKAVFAACPAPRGLLWLSATPAGDAIRVRRGLLLFAAVPAVFAFEPVPGGPMEDAPRARDPRPGVVLLRRRPWGRWRVVRTVFNLSADAVAAGLTGRMSG